MPNRAVVDTNILVSALLKPASLPDSVLQAIRHDMLTPVVCGDMVAEYETVLRRPRLGLPQHEVAELLVLLRAQAQWVHITPYLPSFKLPDPADWPFMASAIAVDCPVITGNTRHFPARLGVRALTAREWVESAKGSAG